MLTGMAIIHQQELLAKIINDTAARYYRKPLLLSGGLDSSILSTVINPDLTVVISFGNTSQDLFHSKIVSQKYSRSHLERIIDFSEFNRLIPNVIRILKTFDPMEVRNSTVLFAGMMEVKKNGYLEVVTGDGADELFAGYNYLGKYYSDPKKLQEILYELWNYMHFACKDIAYAVGMKVHTPYLEEPLIGFARRLDVKEKVQEEKGIKWGKYILRKAFEDKLGSLVWRSKMALEHGSEVSKTTEFIEDTIDDQEFQSEKKSTFSEQVSIRTKEQLYYYRIYRSFFPPPFEESGSAQRCAHCAACLREPGRYCDTCGAFPLTPWR
jgi:asparagine synthase (glutamine-hydrolysing)